MSNEYTSQTKAKARVLYDQGLSPAKIAEQMAVDGSGPSKSTISKWVNPAAAEADRERKRSERQRERDRQRHQAKSWDNAGASRRSAPRRTHYCQCNNKVAAPVLRKDDPKVCITCSHTIEEDGLVRS